jgi:hypothetical protein
MNKNASQSRPAATESTRPAAARSLAIALGGVAVLLALIGLSHEELSKRDSRWPDRRSLVGTAPEAGEIVAGLQGPDEPAQAVKQWSGGDPEEDGGPDPDPRRKRIGNEARAREERERPAAIEPSPAPPPLSQDRDDLRVRQQAEAPGNGPSLPDGSATPLHFQPADGYWSNTHVPGDPEIRLLHARLARWDRSWLHELADLERDVRPVAQPFDAPRDNALSLSLMTDVGSVAEPGAPATGTRVRLQVGIQGIEHRRGLRPAMNVAVVVDLPGDAPDEVRIAARALLDALLLSKQAGDRFSLVMTDSGEAVEPGDFRFGPLQPVRQRILSRPEAPGAAALSLDAALQQAGRWVAESDGSDRPLGSRSVLLITAGPLTDIDRLAEIAHAGAREGVTLSVFPLGNRPQNRPVERLVLAGLGHRRILESPARARQLVEEELHAASRAVARAARLSIRLAPGVHLVDVIGSERLDDARSQRVREIENSMDRRLSENLGIAADRGADEDGIQIVIPSIYSGDSVTVLLDLVVERPGAIADVSLRYKDLVFLRNGSLQGHLELPGGESAPGPAQYAVMKNILSRHFSDAAERAAGALGRNDPAGALAELKAMQRRLERARREQPAWRDDPELVRDLRVLAHFIRALGLPPAADHQSGLADSLKYAAWAKTHRPLEEWTL